MLLGYRIADRLVLGCCWYFVSLEEHSMCSIFPTILYVYRTNKEEQFEQGKAIT